MAHMFAVALALRNPHGLGRRLATLYTYAQPRIGDKKFVAESDRLLHKCAAARVASACVPVTLRMGSSLGPTATHAWCGRGPSCMQEALPRRQRHRHRAARAAHQVDLAAHHIVVVGGEGAGPRDHGVPPRRHLAPGRAGHPGAAPRLLGGPRWWCDHAVLSGPALLRRLHA